MPYYHVYISNSVEIEELDFSRKALVEHIVGPFMSGKKFLCKGKFVDPFKVKEIRIFKTEETSSQFSESTVRLLYQLNLSALNELSEIASDVTRDFIVAAPAKGKNVFIVHGRDAKPVRELKDLLQKVGLNPIVLHEQPSESRTIIEQLERYSDVGYVFIILTPDDIGALRSRFVQRRPGLLIKRSLKSFLELKPRARQNVILELGFFIGKLGRDRVCCLHKGDVELPSDIRGMVYISFKASINQARNKIIKELRKAGYEVKA